jgi:hypothetical protein
MSVCLYSCASYLAGKWFILLFVLYCLSSVACLAVPYFATYLINGMIFVIKKGY